MGKTTDNKRKMHLNAEKAQKRREIANQTIKKAGTQQLKVSDAFQEMKQLLHVTDDGSNEGYLEILQAATAYMLKTQHFAQEKKNVDALTDMVCHIDLCQEQTSVQRVKNMGFQSTPEMSAMTNNFTVDPSTFTYGSGQRHLLNDTPQQTHLHYDGDHSCCVNNSSRQQWFTFTQTGPSAQMGSTTQVELAASNNNLHALASFTEIHADSHIPLKVLSHQTKDITSNFSRYFPQNRTCVSSLNMMQDPPQTSSESHNVRKGEQIKPDAETNTDA